ncbi:hypothetical protein TNIN_469861 [Trichonephila inaurata madagascariensis]|uniref:Uncharacterized protein n=1 Tax=Trichonephila inaurata madagascariensis TaxID=2747483 RepID=A0A8X6XAC3_9ARAC|nr:hypothetical protein TNIN_469861 [Trichonephila inaurata madagascariensis]
MLGARAPKQPRPPPARIGDAESSVEEGETSSEGNSEENAKKNAGPVAAASSPAAAVTGCVVAPDSSKEDDGFTVVSRKAENALRPL